MPLRGLVPVSMRRWAIRSLFLGCPSPRVIAGPFAGMRYGSESSGSVYYPKLLGSYEFELHGIVQAICDMSPSTVIDIGAAEGYYAVGLARRLPEARVIAYEMDPVAQTRMHGLAKLNGVTVESRGECNVQSLGDCLCGGGKTVIVCDVEGFESVLLDPQKLPSLGGAWILVELHEHLVEGVTRLLQDRFAATHACQVIAYQERVPSHINEFSRICAKLPDRWKLFLLSERPMKTPWLWMRPLNSIEEPAAARRDIPQPIDTAAPSNAADGEDDPAELPAY